MSILDIYRDAAPVRSDAPTGGSDESHVVCSCSTHTGLCGTPLPDGDLTPDGAWAAFEVTCAVCADLVEAPCPRCQV